MPLHAMLNASYEAYLLPLRTTSHFRSVVEEKIAEACQFMREHGHTTSLDCVLIIQRSVQILTGKKPDATVAKELFKRLKDKQFPRQLMTS